MWTWAFYILATIATFAVQQGIYFKPIAKTAKSGGNLLFEVLGGSES